MCLTVEVPSRAVVEYLSILNGQSTEEEGVKPYGRLLVELLNWGLRSE